MWVVGQSAVTAPDHGRDERNHRHGVAQADRLAGERERDARLGPRVGGIEEQFGGVVSGLAVDLDAAGEVRGAVVVEPVVVGEPVVGFGDRHQLARAFVVDTERRLGAAVKNGVHPGQHGNHGLHARHVGGIRHIDVGDLVVGHGERLRRPRVEVLHAGLYVHA